MRRIALGLLIAAGLVGGFLAWRSATEPSRRYARLLEQVPGLEVEPGHHQPLGGVRIELELGGERAEVVPLVDRGAVPDPARPFDLDRERRKSDRSVVGGFGAAADEKPGLVG